MSRWEPGARERLVVAAVDLFTEQGYDATTVAQIAERAGVTKSTFFRHFPDKRELLTAGGSAYKNPAANYYRISRDPENSVETTAQLFLGLRIQCARCHHHPFEKWTQDQYYNMAAYFSQVTRAEDPQSVQTDKNPRYRIPLAAHGLNPVAAALLGAVYVRHRFNAPA